MPPARERQVRPRSRPGPPGRRRSADHRRRREFMAYTPSDDNRKFTELYTVQRLKTSNVPTDSQVCICIIQRLYSILKDEPLDESLEEISPAEQLTDRKSTRL